MIKTVSRRQLLQQTSGFVAAVATSSMVSGALAQGAIKTTHHKVTISDFEFTPANLHVKEGDLITWTNRDIAPHTATALDKSWTTKTLKRGESESIKVTKDMFVKYKCKFHPMMKAEL